MSTEANGNDDDGEALGDVDASAERHLAEVDRRLEALADEIAETIGGCPPEEREALHDYAVSLVRERLPVAGTDERYVGVGSGAGASKSGGGETRVSAGYGFLLLPVGFLILPVLPPVGVTVMIIGAGLVVIGIGTALFARVSANTVEH